MQVNTVPFHSCHFSSSFNSNWSTISIWFVRHKNAERDSNRNIALDFPTNFDKWKSIHGNVAEFSDFSLLFSLFVLCFGSSFHRLNSTTIFAQKKKPKMIGLTAKTSPMMDIIDFAQCRRIAIGYIDLIRNIVANCQYREKGKRNINVSSKYFTSTPISSLWINLTFIYAFAIRNSQSTIYREHGLGWTDQRRMRLCYQINHLIYITNLFLLPFGHK